MFRVARSTKTIAAAASRALSLSLARPATVRPAAALFVSRAFSAAPKKPANVAEALLAEIDYEEANAEADQDLEDVQKTIEKVFTVEEKKGTSVVTLRRTYKDESIEVRFDVEDVEEVEAEEPTEEDVLNEEPEMNTAVNFEVTIAKGDGKLVVLCSGSDGITVNQVRFLPAATPNSDVDSYGGPAFDVLDDNVTETFLDYLEERKIDADLGYFVFAYAKNKEQREYVNWLKNVHKFVSK